MARAAGLASVWGRCREGAGAPPFWPWTQVVRALGATVDWSPAGEEARFRLFASVVDVLLAAARPTGLLVVLDDAHRADDSSLRLLGFLADQLGAAPLAVVVTYRDAEAGPVLARLLTDLATQRQCRRRVLGGLSLGAVAEWLAATSGVEIHRAAEVHDRTGGNPFFVREVVRLLADDAASGDIPVSVREVIGSRVAQLPASVRRAVEAAAVLGREFGEAALSALLAVGPDVVAGALQPAVAAHLIEPDRGDGHQRRFVHALVPETVLADLEAGPPRRPARQGLRGAPVQRSARTEPDRPPRAGRARRDPGRGGAGRGRGGGPRRRRTVRLGRGRRLVAPGRRAGRCRGPCGDDVGAGSGVAAQRAGRAGPGGADGRGGRCATPGRHEPAGRGRAADRRRGQRHRARPVPARAARRGPGRPRPSDRHSGPLGGAPHDGHLLDARRCRRGAGRGGPRRCGRAGDR